MESESLLAISHSIHHLASSHAFTATLANLWAFMWQYFPLQCHSPVCTCYVIAKSC